MKKLLNKLQRFSWMQKNMYLIILLLLFQKGFSQVTTDSKVEVDLGGRAFKTGLPFDEPFGIEGKVGANVERVELRYGAFDKEKVLKYFSTPLVYSTDPKDPKDTFEYEGSIRVWDRVGDDGKETSFIFSKIGPIRPNIPYKFKFVTFSKVTFNEEKRKLLKDQIHKKLVKYLGNPAQIDSASIMVLYQELNQLPNIVAEKTITDENGNPIDIKPFVGSLKPISNRIIELVSDLKLNISESQGDKIKIEQLFLKINDIIKYINGEKQKSSKSIVLSDDAKKILQSPIDETIPTIGKTKLIDGIKLVRLLILNPVELDNLLTGKSKFNGTAIIASNQYDPNTISLLSSIFSILNSSLFTENLVVGKKLKLVHVLRDEQTRINIQTIEQLLADQNIDRVKKEGYERELKDIKEFIPNFLENVYSSSTYSIVESSTIDVTSERTPYISADVGVTGMPNTYLVEGVTQGKDFYFFTHQAANIYFSPVNKKAPLSIFKNRYWLAKAFSLHLGVAQLIGDYNNSRYGGSIAEKSSLMFGGGIRFNRVTKVGISCILINRKNINPLIDNTTLKPFMSFNFSFDINVAKGLQGVGKSLNLYN